MKSPNLLRHRLGAIWGLLLLGYPQLLQAHVEHGQATGFSTGFAHPWSGWDHITAMVAVGLWGAELGAPAIWMLPVAFPMVMAVGGFMGLVGIPLPGVEIGIALSAILLGTLVGLEVKPKQTWIAVVIVGVFGLFHGHAHGTELPENGNGLLYSIGFVVATGLLHGVGIALGEIRHWRFGKTLVRLGGAAIAVCGVFFLWGSLHSQAEAETSAHIQPSNTAVTRHT